MKRLSWIVAIGMLLAAPAATSAWQEQANLRTWNLPDTGKSLEAELVSYDAESGEVTLRGEDGGLIQMQATELHISDRRYLNRQMARKDRPQRRRASSSDPIDRALAGGGNNTADPSVQHLYGIDWHRTPQSAQAAATGSQRDADDKPIIWFRVLGDLSGFM